MGSAVFRRIRQSVEKMAFGGARILGAQEAGELVVDLRRIGGREFEEAAVGCDGEFVLARFRRRTCEGFVGGAQEGIEGQGALCVDRDFAPGLGFSFQFDEREEGVQRAGMACGQGA